MKSAHTPTPWKTVSDTAGFKIQPIADFMPEIGHSRLDIAHVNQYDNGLKISACEANAAFIVRAVNGHEDLVKALESAKDFFERMPKGIGRGAASPVYMDICAAIAKAEAE